MNKHLQTKRFLGIELSGAKNRKTTIASLEYYIQDQKIFLLDIFEKLGTVEDRSSDEVLLSVIRSFHDKKRRSPLIIGTNAAAELPPCITCIKKTCPLPTHCKVPAVKWMREITLKKKEFTPYTQRPIELWLRYHVLPELPKSTHFEIDETLGGNRAPLTARMNFLKRLLTDVSMVPVWPKLTLLILTTKLGMPHRYIRSYRKLQEGVHSREKILETITERLGIFIYEKDAKNLARNLVAFDAFICAYTALLSELNLCAKIPRGFPITSGWVNYPNLT